MKCVYRCYFLRPLLDGWYCDLYERPLKKTDGICRCKECENGETLYYEDKMKIYKRKALNGKNEMVKPKETSR